MLHVGLQGVRDKVLGVGEGGFGSLLQEKGIIRPDPARQNVQRTMNALHKAGIN
jgi:hypothetical protein